MPPGLTRDMLDVLPGGARPDDVDTLATILAVDGLLVSAWDRADMDAVGEYVERVRVLLTIWHAARDGEPPVDGYNVRRGRWCGAVVT